jgi:hypothetical protein
MLKAAFARAVMASTVVDPLPKIIWDYVAKIHL